MTLNAVFSVLQSSYQQKSISKGMLILTLMFQTFNSTKIKIRFCEYLTLKIVPFQCEFVIGGYPTLASKSTSACGPIGTIFAWTVFSLPAVSN